MSNHLDFRLTNWKNLNITWPPKCELKFYCTEQLKDNIIQPEKKFYIFRNKVEKTIVTKI